MAWLRGPAWAGRGSASQTRPEIETKAFFTRGGTPPKSCVQCPHFSWKPPPAGQTNIFSKALKPVTHSKERPLSPSPARPSHTPLGLIAPSGASPAQPGPRRWQAPVCSAPAQPGSPPRPGLTPALLLPQVHAAPQELRPDRIVPGEEGESLPPRPDAGPAALPAPRLSGVRSGGRPLALVPRALPSCPQSLPLALSVPPPLLPPSLLLLPPLRSSRRPRPCWPRGRSTRPRNPGELCTPASPASASDVAASVPADWAQVLEAMLCLAPQLRLYRRGWRSSRGLGPPRATLCFPTPRMPARRVASKSSSRRDEHSVELLLKPELGPKASPRQGPFSLPAATLHPSLGWAEPGEAGRGLDETLCRRAEREGRPARLTFWGCCPRGVLRCTPLNQVLQRPGHLPTPSPTTCPAAGGLMLFSRGRAVWAGATQLF